MNIRTRQTSALLWGLTVLLTVGMLMGMAGCASPEASAPSAPSGTSSVPTPGETPPSGTEPGTTEHSHNYISEVTEPTATEQGYTTHTCSICGDSYVDSYTDPVGTSVVASGTCGDNLTWTLDSEGLITISGTGAMDDYDLTFTDKDDNGIPTSPWYVHHDQIKKLHVENGVTGIGLYAFLYCENLTDVTISDSVVHIGAYAFDSCSSLTSVTIPGSVASIDGFVFYSCSKLTSITFLGCPTSIGNRMFENCSNLTSIHFAGTTSQWNALIRGLQMNIGTGDYTV